MDYPVTCPLCGEGAEFRVYDPLGQVPMWVCPDGHGAIRRAGALPLPRQSRRDLARAALSDLSALPAMASQAAAGAAPALRSS